MLKIDPTGTNREGTIATLISPFVTKGAPTQDKIALPLAVTDLAIRSFDPQVIWGTSRSLRPIDEAASPFQLLGTFVTIIRTSGKRLWILPLQ